MHARFDGSGSQVVTLLGRLHHGGEPGVQSVLSPSAGLDEALDFFRLNEDAEFVLVMLAEVGNDKDWNDAHDACMALIRALPAAGLFMTRAAQDLARASTKLDVVYEDFGVLCPEGSSRGERIYAVYHPDLPEPHVAEIRQSGNCPRLQRSFIGRQNEIACLEDLIVNRRLVTVVGPPGMGKSSIVRRIAPALVGEAPDGIWWFAVDDCASAEELVARIAREEKLCGQLSTPTIEKLAERLSPREAILVLDGCDRLPDVVRDLCARVLDLSSTLGIVTTSTEALALEGEALFDLPPLSLGSPNIDLDEHALFQSDALDLLYERAKDAGVLLPLDQRTIREGLQLCRLVDGLPLAIELLASSLRHTSMGLFIEEMSILHCASGWAPSMGLGGLDTALTASYTRLQDDEHELLSRLALFCGSWSIDVARRIAGRDEAADGEFDRIHRSLFDRSWLVCDPDTATYRIMRPLRTFILGKGDDHAIPEHIAGLIRLLQDVAQSVYSQSEAGSRVLLARHYPDFVWALERSLDRADLRPFVSPLVQHLIPIWSRRNLLVDACRLGQQAAQLVSGKDLVRLEMMLGIIAFRRRFYREAKARFEAAQSTSRSILYQLGEAAALCNLAMTHSGAGEHEEAAVLYESGIRLLRTCGDKRRLASALTSAANDMILAAGMNGDLGEPAYMGYARAMLDEVDAMAADDPAILQAVHHNRGRLFLLENDFTKAELAFRHAIAVCEAHDLAHEAFEPVLGLAYVAWRNGCPELAAKLAGFAASNLKESDHGASEEETVRFGVLLTSLRADLGVIRCERLMRYGSRLELSELGKYAFAR